MISTPQRLRVPRRAHRRRGSRRALDAFVTKTVTPLPREGNPPPRIAETESGMLNSIGLQNPGVDAFVLDHLPRLSALGVPLWVSVGGFRGMTTPTCAHVWTGTTTSPRSS